MIEISVHFKFTMSKCAVLKNIQPYFKPGNKAVQIQTDRLHISPAFIL